MWPRSACSPCWCAWPPPCPHQTPLAGPSGQAACGTSLMMTVRRSLIMMVVVTMVLQVTTFPGSGVTTTPSRARRTSAPSTPPTRAAENHQDTECNILVWICSSIKMVCVLFLPSHFPSIFTFFLIFIRSCCWYFKIPIKSLFTSPDPDIPGVIAVIMVCFVCWINPSHFCVVISTRICSFT